MKQSSVLVLVGAALLSGCGLLGGKVPPSLMTLNPAASVAAQTNRSAATGDTITVVAPALVQEINTNRVPVRSGGVAIAYVKDAQWVDTPDTLFRDLLGETIAARTGRVVLNDQQRTLDPGARLTGRLLAFSVDADRSEAVVTYDATLLRARSTQVETRRSEARVPVATIDRAGVSAALNQAANQVAGDIATWIGG
ncbi:MAG: hypothetical protein AVDCRST_MAG91-3200 [uncultured Sphingomonadaceae bacterium]|uniref:ABC-type transport auxiliary lipoprotein component domain-containing protein n=1 Tax=uncultured Sphingomonadaceae bacterium TaxID=169976 RepID=A0A6J4TY41_9SPHN|nr:MAG: hypothetical protein AVDCRST_MAG91-3200 [uncultured Sphingomonadaceae bacterium]